MSKRLLSGSLLAASLLMASGETHAALTNLWRLDEGAGSVAINSAGGVNGTINNSATGGQGAGGNTWVVDPFRGNVFTGNGNDATGAFVSAGTLSSGEMNGNFTWSFWGALSGGTGGNDVILGNRFGGPGWAKVTQTNFEWQPQPNGGGTTGNLNIADIPIDTAWRHHTIVKNGSTFEYYRDGVLNATANFTGTFNAAIPFFMGGDAGGERPGIRMSDVAVFNEALTAGQIMDVRAGDFSDFGAFAAPMIYTPVATTQASTGVFPVSNSDLLQLPGTTVAATGTPVQAHEGTSGNIGVLTNGLFGAANKNDQPLQIVTIDPGTILTYSLDLTGASAGYDITGIDVFTGWNDQGRDEQDYTVQFAFVDNPSLFVGAADVFFNSGVGNPSNLNVLLTNPNGGPIATNVAAIRFVFDAAENGHIGYREIDVFGTASAIIPEPATAGLALLGLSLLGVRRRRA